MKQVAKNLYLLSRSDLKYAYDNDMGVGLQYLGGVLSQIDPWKVDKLIAEGYITNPHVYSVINKILKPGLSVPWYVYEEKDERAAAKYLSYKSNRNHELTLAWQDKAVDIYTQDTPAKKILKKPNSFQTFNQFIESIIGSLCLTGDAFIYRVDTIFGLSEVMALPPQFMKINTDGWTSEVTGYELWLDPSNPIKFKPEEIIWIPTFNPFQYQDGKITKRSLPPLTPLAKVVKQSNDGFHAQMRLLQNGHPIGVLSNGSDMPMTETDVQNVEKSMGLKYGGADNKGKVRFTTANLKWLPLGMNSVDLQIILSQKASLESIASVYSVPLELLSLEGSTFNNKKEAEKTLWNDAILPYFDIVREHLNKSIFKTETRGRKLFLDYDHLSVPALQQDMEKLWKRVEGYLKRHMITPRMANKIMGVDNNQSESNLDRYTLATDVRWGDEELPGQTGQSTQDQSPAQSSAKMVECDCGLKFDFDSVKNKSESEAECPQCKKLHHE